MQKGDEFESVDAARKAIKAYVLDQGESYKTVASNKKRYIIKCKDNGCDFRIRATLTANPVQKVASITILSPCTHAIVAC